MPRGKKELAEQIIPKLREVEVEVGRGKTVLEAVKKIGVTEQTYYRWKKKVGGLRIDQAKRLKDLEKENARLKRLLADAELDSGVARGSIGTRMELLPSRGSYLRWPADPDADGWQSWTSEDVLERLSDPFVHRCVPEHIRSDSRESSRPRASETGWGEWA